MGRVTIDLIWAGSGVVQSPEVTIPGKVMVGWVDEVPPYQWTNWHFNRTDQFLEEVERRGISIYDDLTGYRQHGLAMGSDGEVYRALVATTGNDPVGGPAGKWILAGPASPMIRTILTASDPVWAPTAGVKTMIVAPTGGGGGAGGVADASEERASSGGGGGGTASKVLQAPFLATYAVVVGTGGAGGIGVNGSAGLESSFDGTIVGGGGAGGVAMGGIGGTLPRVLGGVASGGDINSDGRDGSNVIVRSIDGTISATMLSTSGGSVWGGGIATQVSGSNGVSAAGKGYGLGGGALWRALTGARNGGAGADGAVVIEEHF